MIGATCVMPVAFLRNVSAESRMRLRLSPAEVGVSLGDIFDKVEMAPTDARNDTIYLGQGLHVSRLVQRGFGLGRYENRCDRGPLESTDHAPLGDPPATLGHHPDPPPIPEVFQPRIADPADDCHSSMPPRPEGYIFRKASSAYPQIDISHTQE